MRLKTIIESFVFLGTNRKDLTLGNNVRLNPDNYLQLKADVDGFYPTDPDLYVKTWVFNPDSVKQWIGFDVIATQQSDEEGVVKTSLGFRLSDGTDEYWWNGATWVIDTVNWNTENEIAANIDTFPVTEKKLQVVINLVTTDDSYTPLVYEILIAYKSNIEFSEDLIIKTIIPALKNQIRPIGEYLIELASTTSTINIKTDYAIEAPYDIVDIDSVFNHTDDADHFSDIFQSYDYNTGIITLTGSVDAGKEIWINFLYKPLIAMSTDVDYIEADKVPAIHVTSVNPMNKMEIGKYTTVRNKSAGTAIAVVNPMQLDVEIELTAVTSLLKDQIRLGDELERFFNDNEQITSVGLDRKYNILLTQPYRPRSSVGENEIRTGNITFIVQHVLKYHRYSEEKNIVLKFITSGDVNFEI